MRDCSISKVSLNQWSVAAKKFIRFNYSALRGFLVGDVQLNNAFRICRCYVVEWLVRNRHEVFLYALYANLKTVPEMTARNTITIHLNLLKFKPNSRELVLVLIDYC